MTIIKSNMAGTVFKILVGPGDKVSEDQDVVILESMKMELSVQSNDAGIVKEVKIGIDDYVEEGQELIVLE